MHRRVVLFGLAAILALGAGTASESEKARRRPNRLYFGAPPTISHDAGPDMNDCMVCHRDEDMGAPLTPHPTRLRCRQCHVGVDDEAGEFQSNRFKGLPLPSERADRVQSQAPPVMPHPALLREKCLVCHAPDAREDVISTSHPERLRCRQCHLQQSATAGRFPK
jgi:cytochrome c-type protein NapB